MVEREGVIFIYVRICCTFCRWAIILAAMVNHSFHNGRSCSSGSGRKGRTGTGKAGLHEEQKYVDEGRAQKDGGREGRKAVPEVL